MTKKRVLGASVPNSGQSKRQLDVVADAANSHTLAELDTLIAVERPPLVSLGYTLTGSKAVAEELAQEAFLRLYQRWSDVRTYDRPGTWLRRVVVNLASSRARRLRLETLALIRFAGQRSPETVMSPETTEFWAAIRSLPRRQAQVLALYYADDRSVGEVAEILGIAEGTVRASLHQGRQTLRRRFELATDQERPDD